MNKKIVIAGFGLTVYLLLGVWLFTVYSPSFKDQYYEITCEFEDNIPNTIEVYQRKNYEGPYLKPSKEVENYQEFLDACLKSGETVYTVHDTQMSKYLKWTDYYYVWSEEENVYIKYVFKIQPEQISINNIQWSLT
ncbi:hypothetical protein GF326_02255 [Candidatus Bathyarchaeota archaeon]|nr:hypothetical protein [Candidatus Bathyarchaeota archaeon]